MWLSKLFLISLYALAAYSGAVLCWAEGVFFPTGLTPFLALLAYFLNERTGLIRFGAGTAFLLGILGFSVAFVEFSEPELEKRLLAGTHLLVYLTWIMLYLKKQGYEHWWICVLTVLQMAVSAILTNSPFFGLLLFFYFLWSIWTLSVFSLFRAEKVVKVPATENKRSTSLVENSIQFDHSSQWITMRFVLGVWSLAFGSMMLGLAIFFLIPRVWGSSNAFLDQEELRAPSRQVVGFSEKVRLGSIGEAMENTAPAMRVTLYDETNQDPYSVETYARAFGHDTPYLRGIALARYESEQWIAESNDRIAELKVQLRGATVRQEIILEPLGTEVLFTMAPPLWVELWNPPGEVRQWLGSGTIWARMRDSARNRVSYTIHSPKKPLQRRFPPRRGPSDIYLEVPSHLGELSALAQEIASQELQRNPQAKPKDLADALIYYLRDSENFGYTLNLSVQDRSIDPIEDFLFNRKEGHCEYFASSLTLMLRSIGIHSRLVTGFKGGFISPSGNAIDIQQRHAHAWVEAWIEDEWKTLDPTPAREREESLEALGGGPGLLDSLRGMSGDYWSSHILNLNFQRQQRSFYEPLKAIGAFLLTWLQMSGDSIQAFLIFLTTPAEWFTLRGMIMFSIIALSIASLFFVGRFLSWYLKKIRKKLGKGTELVIPIRIGFYEHFLKHLASWQLIPESGQTPLEFAEKIQANSWISGSSDPFLPVELTRAFYGIRFGGSTVTPEIDQHWTARLAKWETTVTTGLAAT